MHPFAGFSIPYRTRFVPPAGFEPATHRSSGERSTTELERRSPSTATWYLPGYGAEAGWTGTRLRKPDLHWRVSAYETGALLLSYSASGCICSRCNLNHPSRRCCRPVGRRPRKTLALPPGLMWRVKPSIEDSRPWPAHHVRHFPGRVSSALDVMYPLYSRITAGSRYQMDTFSVPFDHFRPKTSINRPIIQRSTKNVAIQSITASVPPAPRGTFVSSLNLPPRASPPANANPLLAS